MCPGELEPPHAKAKGSECRNERKPGRQALAAGREQVCRRVRRPAGRSRGRATPATRTALADAPFPTEPDLPVCERHDPTGEPGALNRHAGFGERGAETWQCERMRHPHDAKAAGKRLLPHAKAGASLPDSTGTVFWLAWQLVGSLPCDSPWEPGEPSLRANRLLGCGRGFGGGRSASPDCRSLAAGRPPRETWRCLKSHFGNDSGFSPGEVSPGPLGVAAHFYSSFGLDKW